MHDSAKYLIHADVRASGVVERSDVVGAVFGQTEGLLGDGLDLRDLQESGKLGHIDVHVESERGSSFGEITIASGLDRAETAILAAALESIDRVGPCRADVEVAEIEDVRTAKRREVVERAKELLAEFDETALSSDDIVEEVRQSVRVEDVTEYRGLPAGPRVADSDAVIVVEGRSDVGRLLRYGIKNAVAVEGTDVPDAVAELTDERTVTAFLDGDRAGDLILKELSQVGDVDYVALAPADRSVEDLTREEVLGALRDKVPFDAVSSDVDAADPDATDAGTDEPAATDGSVVPAPPEAVEDGPGDVSQAPELDGDASADATDAVAGALDEPTETDAPSEVVDDDDGFAPGDEPSDSLGVDAESAGQVSDDEPGASADLEAADGGTEVRSQPVESGRADADGLDGSSDAVDSDGDTARTDDGTASATDATAGAGSVGETDDPEEGEPETLAGHVESVVAAGSGRVRFLDAEFAAFESGPAAEAFERLEAVDETPETVVLDEELAQRLLDLAAQRGVSQVVARDEGEFVKKPTAVRIRTADEF